MIYYAEGIRKFQKQLGLPVSDFTDLMKTQSSSTAKEENSIHVAGN